MALRRAGMPTLSSVDVGQNGFFPVQGDQVKALSDPLVSYFFCVKTSRLARHLGYRLLDQAGLPYSRPTGK